MRGHLDVLDPRQVGCWTAADGQADLLARRTVVAVDEDGHRRLGRTHPAGSSLASSEHCCWSRRCYRAKPGTLDVACDSWPGPNQATSDARESNHASERASKPEAVMVGTVYVAS